MDNLNPLSHWQAGERVKGIYCGIPFSGSLLANTRPTYDYKNVIFCVLLDEITSIFGKDRTTIEIWTNDKNEIYRA
jgi:hypothetical protein